MLVLVDAGERGLQVATEVVFLWMVEGSTAWPPQDARMLACQLKRAIAGDSFTMAPLKRQRVEKRVSEHVQQVGGGSLASSSQVRPAIG
jgi:hypothetical protein